MNIRAPRLFALALAFGLMTCATARSGAGIFEVQCNVPEAMVLIDDVVVGRAADWAPPGRAIRPGFRRVEIRYPGYHSHYAEIDIADGGGARVKAELHLLLD